MSSKQQDVPLEELDQRPQINVNDKPITDEPKASPAMKQEPQSNNENSQNLKSKESNSDDDINSHFTATSGYQRESNECTEFCIECCTCFGVLNCCPNNGEGCVTNMATFIGNMLFACCKC
ncbi:hypothetical protein FOB64_002684 [Candida albicans]|uniref:Uncharacterized protein n=1 Tax=Candida albicans TaxID=5476 RepID=A0A8H6F4X1_CANAX|nr:hypothetical protein FOB64_002684 [Candida albicans]